MNAFYVYALTGVVLFGIGLHSLVTQGHFIRKLLALNVMSSSVFLLLVSMANRVPTGEPDPIPHAMVLTGIVVSVSATALALALARRIYTATGQTRLSGENPE